MIIPILKMKYKPKLLRIKSRSEGIHVVATTVLVKLLLKLLNVIQSLFQFVHLRVDCFFE